MQMRFKPDGISQIVCKDDKNDINAQDKPEFRIFNQIPKKTALSEDAVENHILLVCSKIPCHTKSQQTRNEPLLCGLGRISSGSE